MANILDGNNPIFGKKCVINYLLKQGFFLLQLNQEVGRCDHQLKPISYQHLLAVV